jgi:hypothetical protein
VGKSVAQNYDEAIQWIQLAAGQGHATGQANLGEMYLRGQGVAQSDAEAFHWFQKAAGQGDTRAQSMLAKLYANGRGVKKNDKLVLYWLLNSGLSRDGKTIVIKDDIPAEAIKLMPELFEKTPELQRVSTLQLAGLKLDDQIASSLAQLLAENQTLEVLDLRGSKIDEKGAALLALALRSNLMLKELHLDGMAGSGTARADIAASIESNKNIAALTLAVQTNPVHISDVLPLEVIDIIEQVTIVADQKAGEVSRSKAQTQELLDEMRLAFAHQSITHTQ